MYSTSRPYKASLAQKKAYRIFSVVPAEVPIGGKLGFFEGVLFKTPAGSEVTGRVGTEGIRRVLQYLDSIPQLSAIGKAIHDAAKFSRKEVFGEDDAIRAFRNIPANVLAAWSGKSITDIENERRALAAKDAQQAPSLQSQCTNVCKSRYPGKIMSPKWSNGSCFCNIQYTASATMQSKCVTVCRNKYPGRTMNPQWSNNNCYCNLSSSNVTMQSKCATVCRNKYPGRTMNPSWSNNNCYCNLGSTGGGTGSRFPTKSGTSGNCSWDTKGGWCWRGTACGGSCRICRTGYATTNITTGCNAARSHFLNYYRRCSSCGGTGGTTGGSAPCPYSGCSSSKAGTLGCYRCRCTAICKKGGYPGVKSVSSNGSCYCNPKSSGTQSSLDRGCSYSGCNEFHGMTRCSCRCRKICGSRGVKTVTSSGACYCKPATTSSGGCSTYLKQRCGNFCAQRPGDPYLDSKCSCFCR